MGYVVVVTSHLQLYKIPKWINEDDFGVPVFLNYHLHISNSYKSFWIKLHLFVHILDSIHLNPVFFHKLDEKPAVLFFKSFIRLASLASSGVLPLECLLKSAL